MPRKEKEAAQQEVSAKTAKAAVDEKMHDILSLNEKYIQSLKDPDNIYTGNRNLLKGSLRETWRQWVATEKEYSKLYDNGFKGMGGADKIDAETKFQAARDRFHSAMDDFAQKVASQKVNHQRKNGPREPQMVTVNGDKVSHGHAFQSNTNPENWYFTAKINDRQLNPQKMDPADLTAYQKKEIDVPGLMAKYYPTKVAERLPFDKIKADNVLEDGRTVDRFNIYKETREGPNKGKYMIFAQVGDDKVSARASQHTLNAFFDRTETYSQMVTKNLGERLHLKSAYQQYSLPEAAGITDIRAVRNTDGHWYLNAKMDGKDMAGKQLEYNDGYAFFKAKTATAEQLAGKYFHKEIADKLGGGQGQNIENSKSASIKLS